MYGWVGVGAKNKACLECSGIPAEVEFVEVNVARKTYTPGKCATCGKEANLTKSNGYRVCSTCEHLVRGVKNKPELIRRLLSQIHGDRPGNGTAVSERELFELKEANAAMAGTLDDIREALGVKVDTPGGDLPGMIGYLVRERGEYALELDEVIKALEADAGDSLVDVAERRMAVLRKLDASYAEAYERAEGLEREVEIGNESRTNLQREVDSLRAQLKQYNEENARLLGIKHAPADHLPVSRLLADRDLLAAVNLLAGAMGER